MNYRRVSRNLYKPMGGEGMNEVRLKEIETNWKTWGMWADEGTKYPIERDDVNEVLELVAEIRRLQRQNQCYREALKRIDKQASDIVSRNFDYVAVGNLFELGLIAQEALGGEG